MATGKMSGMTIQDPDRPSILFSENVKVPFWVIGILGLVLGVTAGAMTGVAVRNLVGDDPIIAGSDATLFYVCFALAVLLDIFLLFNFTNLAITVNDRGLEFRYGMFGKFFAWDTMSNAKSNEYRWITYGGWGIRFSTQGRRAWSQLSVKEGVVVDVTEGGKKRHYFISTRRPEELESVLLSKIAVEDTEPPA